jgi:hypothetical protein
MTANNSALSGSDYLTTSGTLAFGSGVNTQTISVTINGDKTVEPNETFFVNLSSATNGASIGDGQGVGTIVNDDTAAVTDDYADSFFDTTAPFGQTAVGTVASGNLETTGDRDWFRVSLTAGVPTVINLMGVDSSSGTLTDPYLYLYDASGNLITQDDDSGVGFNSELNYTPGATGTYYIGAAAFADGYTGTYAIQISGSAPPDDFSDSFTDTTAPFGQVIVNGATSGNLELAGDHDWFRVQLTAGATYTIDLQAAGAGIGTLSDSYLRLYNNAGQLITLDDDSGPSLDSQIVYTVAAVGHLLPRRRRFRRSVRRHLHGPRDRRSRSR